MTKQVSDILLMTATIEPSMAMPGTTRADPELRRLDYLEALAAYLRMPAGVPDRIVFCENSGADLSALRELVKTQNPHGKKVDFLTFLSDCPHDRGKGYAELDILDRAHEEFFFDDEDAKTLRIWKVTGRLLVENLAEMIETAPRSFKVYADFRSVPFIGEALGGNEWMDTRFLAYTPEGYSQFLHRKNANVGWTIEKSLYAFLRSEPEFGTEIIPRFRRQPRIVGVCGGSGADYGGVGKQAKQVVRSLARRAAPFLWL